jgi:hypothetical protein
MKRLFFWMIAAIVLHPFGSMCLGVDFTGEYENKYSLATVTQKGNSIKFSISSSFGQNSCDIEGIAKMVDKNRAAYTNPTDSEDNCVIVLNFNPGVEGMALKITTKECDGYCGLNAAGSMDGLYIKKKKQATSKKIVSKDSTNFFSDREFVLKTIDLSIAESMLTGHYGCVEKAKYFLLKGSEQKNGSPEQILMDKIAWYNIVNAHRMLDSVYREMSGKEKQQVHSNLQRFDRIIEP